MQRKNLHSRSWQCASDRHDIQVQVEGLGCHKTIGTSPSVARIIPVWSKQNG